MTAPNYHVQLKCIAVSTTLHFFFPWEWDKKKKKKFSCTRETISTHAAKASPVVCKGGRTRILNSIFHIIPIWFITEQLHHHIHKLFKDKFLILSYLLQNNLGQLCKGKT